MRRGGRREAKIEEEEDEKQNLSKSAAGVSDDDDEGNEDLSLKIVEKSLMRAAMLDRNNANVLVLEDPSLGSGSDSGVVELPPSSPSLVTQAVDACPIGTKKKRRKKIKAQIADQSVIISNEEKIAETAEEVETIEEVPAVANAGDVSVNAVMQKLLRGPRYFDAPASGGWSSCYNCGEEGHMTANCPSFTKKKKPCFVCGSLDHVSRHCRKDKDCFICKQVGHRAKDCPEKHKAVSKICLRCGNSGHHMLSCSADYSHDDLKEIQCYICKSSGHLCCANYVDDSSIEVSCYRCGNVGHTGLSCSRLHEESMSNASPSFCYKCGEGGHFARECSNSTRFYDEGTIPSLSLCYKCGEGGHFARECRGSAKFYDEGTIPSLSLCYKCGEGGHFARECRSSAKAGKRRHELSIPALRVHTDIKDNNIVVKSAPHDIGKKRKRKTISEQKSTSTPPKEKRRGRRIIEDSDDLRRPGTTTPSKSRHRGGWITEDPGDMYTPNNWRSPSTPSYNRASGPHISSPQSFKQTKDTRSVKHGFEQEFHVSRSGSSSGFQQGYPDSYHHGRPGSYHHGNPSSTPPALRNRLSTSRLDSGAGYEHGYSESRFGQFQGSNWKREQYGWG